MANTAAADATRRARVAIIGTAGRGEDAARMTAKVFDAMVARTGQALAEWKLAPAQVHLVSGGAAWADHVAVRLFLGKDQTESAFAGLTLHLPCAFDHKAGRALDTGRADWRTNPGRSMNQYHAAFTRAVKSDTLREITAAQKAGAELVTTYRGFHERNGAVAASDYVIAFTWGAGATPKDGGTADTWAKARRAVRIHVPLGGLVRRE